MQIKKLARTKQNKQKPGVMAHACYPSYEGGSWSEAGLGKSVKPYPENKLRQQAGFMAQVVEH
jgi:hypothetical protein